MNMRISRLLVPALGGLFAQVQYIRAQSPDDAPSPQANGKYCLTSTGIRAEFIPYGASLTNLFIEDKQGEERDIVLGFDNATAYSDPKWHPHLNGVPGRYANRIKNGTFVIDGTTYHTDLNEKGLDALHGGSNGWDYRDWFVVAYTTSSITFSLRDADGEMGFPGEVVAYVTYTLTPYQWHISMTALSLTKKTLIMLSSHTYWNLDGFQNPETPLALNHTLHLPYATRRIAIDNIEIPTGEILNNQRDQAFDFWSKPKQLGEDLNKPVVYGACGFNCTGYDNAFLFDDYGPPEWESTPVATLASEWSGIRVDVFCDQPAYQIYTCNNMNGTIRPSPPSRTSLLTREQVRSLSRRRKVSSMMHPDHE